MKMRDVFRCSLVAGILMALCAVLAPFDGGDRIRDGGWAAVALAGDHATLIDRTVAGRPCWWVDPAPQRPVEAVEQAVRAEFARLERDAPPRAVLRLATFPRCV